MKGRHLSEAYLVGGKGGGQSCAGALRILNTELDEHLDDERETDEPGNRHNGHSKKTVLTGTSKMQLSIPRDRAGTFDPKLIAKYHAASAELLDDGSIEITFA